MDIISLIKNYKYLYLYFSFKISVKLSQTCKFLRIYCSDLIKIYKNNYVYINSIYGTTNDKLCNTICIYKLEKINYIPNGCVSIYYYLKNVFPSCIDIDKYIHCFKITMYKNPVKTKDIIIANILKSENSMFIDYYGFYYSRDNIDKNSDFIASDINELNSIIIKLISN